MTMKCPRCDGYCHTREWREPKNTFCTINRIRKCSKCGTEIKTSEKVIFSTLPSDIKIKFLNEGKRK